MAINPYISYPIVPGNQFEVKQIIDKERRRDSSTLFCLFQSGLIVACYHGYMEIVIALSQCPYLDINWQDNEGNTALITAAQAGKHTSLEFLKCLSQYGSTDTGLLTILA